MKSIMLLTGQRIDIVVHCNQKKDAYYLRAVAYHHHGKMPGMAGKMGLLTLRYKGVEKDRNPSTNRNEKDIISHKLVQPYMKPLRPLPPPIEATRTLELDLVRHTVPNVGLRWFVGNVTLRMPQVIVF